MKTINLKITPKNSKKFTIGQIKKIHEHNEMVMSHEKATKNFSNIAQNGRVISEQEKCTKKQKELLRSIFQ